jgi:hypothetical protein
MKNGIRRRDLSTLEEQIRDADIEKERRETMQDELEAARERQDALREQIDRLRGMLNRSRQAVAFEEDHFRAAISCGLRIAGSEPLRARGTGEHDPRSTLSPRSTSAKEPTPLGPLRSTPCASRAIEASACGSGVATRPSGRWSSRTPES